MTAEHLNPIAQLAAKIESRFWGQLRAHRGGDLSNLIETGLVTEEFAVALLSFSEAIDGYAGSARALRGCDRRKLLKVQSDVSKSFFERYLQYDHCRTLITEANTPDLYRRLIEIENYRRDLLSLVESILCGPDGTAEAVP